jgi:rhodanese-related sulfurtransferase
MMFKKLIQTLLLGVAIWAYLSIDPGQNSILAATLTETTSISQSKTPNPSKPIDLELRIDRFLMSMPAGYYTISSVEKLKSQLEKSQTLLVDVRKASEYRSGHIPNAINIPLQTLARNLSKIPTDRPVVLYCSSGYRSGMGVMTLHLFNYDNVQGFPPSFVSWKAAGELVVK